MMNEGCLGWRGDEWNESPGFGFVAHHLDAAVRGSVEHLVPHGEARVRVEPLHDEAVALVFLRMETGTMGRERSRVMI